MNDFGTCILTSAMETMQKSQCNSRYVRYHIPSIVSARLSQTYIKQIENKEREKRFLPPITSLIQAKILPIYKKYSTEQRNFNESVKLKKIQDFKISQSKEDNNLLEITGLANLHLHPVDKNSFINSKKIDLECRRNSISNLENERREKYYENYYKKQQKITLMKIVQQGMRKRIDTRDINEKIKENKEKFKEIKEKYKSKSSVSHYIEDFVETCEISLQTPDFFTTFKN